MCWVVMTELRYSKDGVPIYDGTAELFVAYKRAALNYVETLEWKKRPLAGPRLQSVLEGAARTAVQHKSPGWISHSRGAEELLTFLKTKVQPPTLAEAGKSISRFFYQVKRRKGECMNAWIVRHDESLFEARRTLAEAIEEYEQGYSSRRTSLIKTSTSKPRPSKSTSSQHGSQHADQHQEQGPFDSNGLMRDEDDLRAQNPDEPDPWRDYAGWHDWNNDDEWTWGSWEKWETEPRVTKEMVYQAETSDRASEEAGKFLPDFVVAWMLLQRSGLDGSEKTTIIASLKNEFTTERVKEALKLNWTDEDLRKRDQVRGSALMLGEEEDDAFLHEEDTPPAPTWMTEEEVEEYNYLTHETEEALAAIQGARRTLRNAREKQSMMRKSRQFYPMKKETYTKWRTERSESERKCFRCGGAHKTETCPKKNENTTGQAVHFTFTASSSGDQIEPDAAEQSSADFEALAAMTMNSLLEAGKAIIDPGATSTVGSVDAMTRIDSINRGQGLQREIQIDPKERPSFRFGNNGRTTCLSTAQLPVPLHGGMSTMRVHVHDIPNQPVLLSIASLRALGAVIDYDQNTMLLKRVDPHKVLKLETTSTGHQVFPLTADVYSQSRQREKPFGGLIDDHE